jgi:hypothetical protein
VRHLRQDDGVSRWRPNDGGSEGVVTTSSRCPPGSRGPLRSSLATSVASVPHGACTRGAGTWMPGRLGCAVAPEPAGLACTENEPLGGSQARRGGRGGETAPSRRRDRAPPSPSPGVASAGLGNAPGRVRELLRHAQLDGAREVVAHTDAERSASTSVCSWKTGFELVDGATDLDGRPHWRWSRPLDSPCVQAATPRGP